MEWKESCDRVDYVLLSRSLAARSGMVGVTNGEEIGPAPAEGRDGVVTAGEENGVIKEADILMSEAERGPSDHVPIWVSLDTTGR